MSTLAWLIILFIVLFFIARLEQANKMYREFEDDDYLWKNYFDLLPPKEHMVFNPFLYRYWTYNQWLNYTKKANWEPK